MRSLTMDNASMNPYEQQLYTVFKTFDVENEEALNKSAVLDLCDALQLEDRGAALVGTLFERSSDRVTFTQFRNGLLSVLSGDSAAAPATEQPGPAAPAPAAHSDEDSSGREVAPKFVFGSKKYGRRSRPQRGSDTHAPRAASVSRLDAADGRARSAQRMRCRRSASAMESRDLDSNTDDESATDAFDHDRRIDRDEALALCRDLRMDGIDSRLVDRIFEDSGADNMTTVGQFFDRLNASLTSSIEGTCEAGGIPGPAGGDPEEDDDAGVASELVVDAWERAGVPRPRRLLLELGFGAAAVRPPDLERALDDELAALAEPLDERRDARTLVLVATLALGRLRLRRARRRADLAAAERDKLRTDVAEANRRARLLAQDVDETHARMEAELTANLRRAEVRHAEAARQAAEEAASERERAGAIRSRLEAEVARRSEMEARLRAEAEAERERGERLEARALSAENRAAAAEREAARLAEEVRGAAARAGAGAGAGGAGDEATRDLEARLEELRLEAQRLRDRNDELCGALEARANAGPGLGLPADGTACGDLSAELRSLMTPEVLEDCDSAPASIEQKVLDYREAARRLRVIFEAVGAAGPGEREGPVRCGACAALGDVQARVRELSDSMILAEGRPDAPGLRDCGAQTDAVSPQGRMDDETAVSLQGRMDAETAVSPQGRMDAETAVSPQGRMDAETAVSPQGWMDPKTAVSPLGRMAPPALRDCGEQTDADSDLKLLVDELRKDLADTESRHENEKLKLSDLVRELEASLEALREEYERCEEYWAGKLGAERDAHDAELRAGDERLAELVARVADYERRYAPPPPRLPPIEECAALEAQVAELERETAAARAAEAAAAAALAARDAELRRLRDSLAAAERRRRPRDYRNPAFDAPTTPVPGAEGAGAGAVGGGGGACACACAALAARCGRLGACLAAVRGAGAREAAALRTRAARAEAALRRLHARLHAADVLVKELYVENCHLAHRRAP